MKTNIKLQDVTELRRESKITAVVAKYLVLSAVLIFFIGMLTAAEESETVEAIFFTVVTVLIAVIGVFFKEKSDHAHERETVQYLRLIVENVVTPEAVREQVVELSRKTASSASSYEIHFSGDRKNNEQLANNLIKSQNDLRQLEDALKHVFPDESLRVPEKEESKTVASATS